MREGRVLILTDKTLDLSDLITLWGIVDSTRPSVRTGVMFLASVFLYPKSSESAQPTAAQEMTAPVAESTATPLMAVTPSAGVRAAAPRIFWLDKVKVFMTFMVVMQSGGTFYLPDNTFMMVFF